ncbi:MAG: hypothetical protein V5B60_07670 [Accumulibacter sp.]|jgi:hypothetical protein|uniref:hypothetical protein n=1 Tax=Accumulibacter sp. TaxID=2053492 RepID=UPI002FC3CCDA
MSPAEIIERATEEGVLLALSPSGSISATLHEGVTPRKGPNKDNVKSKTDSTRHRCNLRTNELKRSRFTGQDSCRPPAKIIDAAHTDPDIVAIGIRNVATLEMNIPQAYYDACALLELIEKHTGDEHANA